MEHLSPMYMTHHFPSKCNLPPGLHPHNFFMPGYLSTFFWLLSSLFVHCQPMALKAHWKLSSKKVNDFSLKVLQSESSAAALPWVVEYALTSLNHGYLAAWCFTWPCPHCPSLAEYSPLLWWVEIPFNIVWQLDNAALDLVCNLMQLLQF